MTCKEYLDKLSQALYFLDEDARQSAISFHSEMLDDRMEEGMTEEEAVAAMDDPEVTAARLKEEMQHHAPENNQPAQHSDDYVPCKFVYKAEELKSLSTHLFDRAVQILPSRGDLVIEYQNDTKNPIEINFENGHLSLVQKHRNTSWKTTVFSLSSLLNQLFSQDTLPDLCIYIHAPVNILLDMQIQTTNGKITSDGLDGFGAMQFNTTNGKIHLSNIRAQALKCVTTNGPISLDHVYAPGAITARSTNGKIVYQHIECQNDVTLATTNSKLDLTSIVCAGKLDARTTNGSIHVASPQANHISLTTSNGGIHGTLPGPQSDWQISSRTSNGSSNLPTQQNGSKELTVRTSNGSIRIEFTEN